MDIDVTNKIERLPDFEDRLGVVLDCLSAFVDKDHLEVRGEFRSKKPGLIRGDTDVVIAIYDSANRVVGVASHNIYEDSFCGLEMINVWMKISSPQISKIRIYPKRA